MRLWYSAAHPTADDRTRQSNGRSSELCLLSILLHDCSFAKYAKSKNYTVESSERPNADAFDHNANSSLNAIFLVFVCHLISKTVSSLVRMVHEVA
jgi:hypothetical protein